MSFLVKSSFKVAFRNLSNISLLLILSVAANLTRYNRYLISNYTIRTVSNIFLFL